MGDMSNRYRGRKFREVVSLQLQLEGIEEAHVKPLSSKPLSEGLDGPPEADIEGLPGGWWVDVSAGVRDHLSTRLDAAEMSASLAGRDRAALVQYRAGRGEHRPTSDAFVIMRLSTFASVLRRDAELEKATP